MRRALLVLVPLLLAPLAGCLTPPEGTLTAAADATGAAQGAGNVTAADWFALDATAGPDAPLSGFWWTVPEGAVVKTEHTWNDKPVTAVVLEVALMTPEGEDVRLDEMALLAFKKEKGALRPLLETAWTPLTYRMTGALGAGEEEREEVEVHPFFVHLGFDELDVGDAVGFVVGGRTNETTPYRLAFRALEKAPDWSRDEPAADAPDFVKARAGRAPVALTPTGAGQGLQTALYVEVHGLWMLPPMGIEVWSDAVVVETKVHPDARPALSRRATTLSADFPRAGYGIAGGAHWAMNAVGEWTAEGDVHGETVDGGGRIVEAGHFGGSWLFGVPAFLARGEGETGGASAFHVDVVSGGGWEFLLFVQLDLGATLATLLGEDVHEGAWTGEGLVPEARVGLRGSDIHVVHEGGPVQVLLGAMPVRE